MEVSNQILSDITVYMKYAKYLPELERRETWEELVTRNKNMHIKKYPELKEEIEEKYQIVYMIKKFFHQCVVYNLEVSQLKYLQTEYIIAHIFL